MVADVLVIGEIALTLTLLVGAGLLLQSFRHVLQVDTGFSARNLLAMRNLRRRRRRSAGGEFLRAVATKRSRALPGVKSFAVSDGLPFGEDANHPAFLIEGRPVVEKKANGQRYSVSPDYFQTMGIELLKVASSLPPRTNRDHPRVIVIDEVLARSTSPVKTRLESGSSHGQDSPEFRVWVSSGTSRPYAAR